MDGHRVVIVYRHTLFCEGLISILRRHSVINLVGMIAESNDLADRVKALRPDVIVVDASLSHDDGRDSIQGYWKEQSSLRVICLSLDENGMTVYSKQLLHDAGERELLEAIGIGNVELV